MNENKVLMCSHDYSLGKYRGSKHFPVSSIFSERRQKSFIQPHRLKLSAIQATYYYIIFFEHIFANE